MEIYKKINAVWVGTNSTEDYSVVKIIIDISSIKKYLLKYDLFTITSLIVKCKIIGFNSYRYMRYQYTKLHTIDKQNIIQFNVNVYGNIENIEINECSTKGYFVCKEE